MPAGVPLLLVDGHNLLWRAAFGFPAAILSRDKTRDLTAEFGFFALLRVAIRDELPEPPEVLVVFDGEHGAAERKDSDADYKANRVLDEAALKPLRAIPHVQRDFYQLVDDRVRALNTVMKRGRRHIGPAEVVERYGVTPDQWPDFCALKGDSADNIPGVKGIGEGTAAKLLAGGLGLDRLLTSGRLTGAKKTAVTDTWQQVLAWRDLIRMRTDLDLPHHPTGYPSRELPKPADVIEKLGLW
jgi:DNA polymerase-1